MERRLPDGSVILEQVPLTLEDALHPQGGDVIPKSSEHQTDRYYLRGVFDLQVRGDPTALVYSDVLIRWDVPGLRPHSPDLAVIFGVTEPGSPRAEFDVAAEGCRPCLIVEVAAPESRVLDTVTKVDHYDRAKVPLYVVVDRQELGGPVSLLGYRRTRAGYTPLSPDEKGRLWLGPVRLWVAVREKAVVCFDEAGRELEDYVRLCQRPRALRDRADGPRN